MRLLYHCVLSTFIARPVLAASSFVSTSGTGFALGGAPFNFAGTNAYWLAQLDNDSDVTSSFASMTALGLRVVRTWAFNEVTSPQTFGAYYTLWSNGTQTFNAGPNGFDRLDYVISAAETVGLKVILTLTNQWGDYGGMDRYISELSPGSTHDAFYTDTKIIAAYQNFVSFVVNRYKASTTVFAWELANEARCAGTLAASSSCTTNTVTTWIQQQSAFIKSLDPNHLVSIGDEGYFASNTSSSDFLYNGRSGIDFSANLAVQHVDFGTFHQYPVGWGEAPALEWGQAWIEEHAAVAITLGKPIILEEFGVPGDVANKTATYSAWFSTAEASKLAGVMYWQFGTILSSGASTDDGFTIFPNQSSLIHLIKGNAAVQNALSLAPATTSTARSGEAGLAATELKSGVSLKATSSNLGCMAVAGSLAFAMS